MGAGQVSTNVMEEFTLFFNSSSDTSWLSYSLHFSWNLQQRSNDTQNIQKSQRAETDFPFKPLDMAKEEMCTLGGTSNRLDRYISSFTNKTRIHTHTHTRTHHAHAWHYSHHSMFSLWKGSSQTEADVCMLQKCCLFWVFSHTVCRSELINLTIQEKKYIA